MFKARALGPAGFEREVVIKRILPAYGRDEDFVRMFVDEARILGLIHHPNVVQAFEFGEDDGTLFLALEYVNGPSLSRILRALRAANRRMPPAIAAYVGREICRALDCVHRLEDENGVRLEVVHRDVTPSNIIVTPWGGVKLLDFGVAKFTSAARSTREGTVKGKPAYLAPEQLQGKPIDGRVDLFALGIVLHEMLSLQHLFTGDSDLQTAKKIMEMKIPRLSAHRADVPEELERIVLRALERERQYRFGTAAEMARALDDFVVGSKLHQDEVAAFIHQIEAISPMARPAPLAEGMSPHTSRESEKAAADLADPQEGPTVKDSGLRLKMWRSRPRGPHLAAAIGLSLAALGLGTAFGLKISTAAGQPPAAPAAVSRQTTHETAGTSDPLVERDRRAGAAREDLRAELLVARLERAIDGAIALAGIVNGDSPRGQLGGRRVHHRREGVIEHGDPVGIVARIAFVDVTRAVVVVRPPAVRLVIAGDFFGDALTVTLGVQLDDGLGHHAAAVAPVRELARAELDVGHRIHEVLPGDATHVAIRATIAIVEQAADRHQSAVLGVDLSVARVDARRFLVHVALVDHDRQQQRRAQIVALRRGGDRVGDPSALGRRPGRCLPANFFLHRADRLRQAGAGMHLTSRVSIGVGGRSRGAVGQGPGRRERRGQADQGGRGTKR